MTFLVPHTPPNKSKNPATLRLPGAVKAERKAVATAPGCSTLWDNNAVSQREAGRTERGKRRLPGPDDHLTRGDR